MPSSDLHPTPTRLALLKAIREGMVFGDATGDAWYDERLGSFYDPLTAERFKVTARVREMRDAGWIECGMHREYRLTEQGQDLLTSAARPNPSDGAS